MNTATNTKTGTRMLAIRARHIRALELRREGKIYREIAEELGYRDKAAAYKGVLSAMADARKEVAVPALQMELERLDTLQCAVSALIEDATSRNDTDGVLRGISVALAVSDRRAKFLGLDVLGKTQTATVTIEEEVRRLSELTGLDEGAILTAASKIVAGGVNT